MSLLSGCLGATASCLAKFALENSDINNNSNNSVVALRTQALSVLCGVPEDTVVATTRMATNSTYYFCSWVSFVVTRGLCFAGMIICNAYMLGTFLKGMEESGSVAGTALSTASNFVVSACYGYVLWGERFSVIWWTGFSMVITGVMLLSVANTPRSNESHAKRD